MESNFLQKKKYLSPDIQCVLLDNSISLALESSPPEGPYEVINQDTKYFNIEPFKNEKT